MKKFLLNPDCGFGTFAQRPMNSDEIAFEKLKVMVEAAKKLREMVRDLNLIWRNLIMRQQDDS